MYRLSQLDNGFRVATVEMPERASVSVGLWLAVGSRHEPERVNGICHFIEHMLFKGTRKRTARQIIESVEGRGGELNAYTAEEHTCYYARGHCGDFAEVLDVLLDMFRNAAFPPVEVRKERHVIKEEIAMYADQPSSLAMDLLDETLWPGHPMGRNIVGSSASLDRIRRRDLVGFVGRHYVPANGMIVVAGPVSHEAVLKRVGRHLRGLAPGDGPLTEPLPNGQFEPRLRVVRKSVEQTQVVLGVRTCSRHDPRRHSLRILNTILGENMSSRLFQIVREDHGLAYSVESTSHLYEDSGVLTIAAGLDAGVLRRALRLILKELRRLKEGVPGLKEVRQAQEFQIGQLELTLESTENHMTWLGEHVLGHGRVPDVEEVKQRLQAVRPRHVREVALEFLRPERLSLALVCPRGGGASLRRELQAELNRC